MFTSSSDNPSTFNIQYSGCDTVQRDAVTNISIRKVDWSTGTSIGNWFISNCSNLTSVDLSGLSGATSVGDHFMRLDTVLTAVDLSPLSNLTSIGTFFLDSLYACKTFDLSFLTNLNSTTLPDNFMSGEQSWQNPELSPLSYITGIGTYFLAGSFYNETSATSLNISPLVNLTSIGYGFLYDCKYITTITIPDNLTTGLWSSADDHSFSVKDENSPAYTTGVTLIGNIQTISSIKSFFEPIGVNDTWRKWK